MAVAVPALRFHDALPPYALLALPEPPPQEAEPPRAVAAEPPWPRVHEALPPYAPVALPEPWFQDALPSHRPVALPEPPPPEALPRNPEAPQEWAGDDATAAEKAAAKIKLLLYRFIFILASRSGGKDTAHCRPSETRVATVQALHTTTLYRIASVDALANTVFAQAAGLNSFVSLAMAAANTLNDHQL